MNMRMKKLMTLFLCVLFLLNSVSVKAYEDTDIDNPIDENGNTYMNYYIDDIPFFFNFNSKKAEVGFLDPESNMEPFFYAIPPIVRYKGEFFDVVKIHKTAFMENGLETIYIPDSVKEIGDEAFRACHNLTSIRLPKSLERINDGVFNGCHSLKALIIPDSVVSIGNNSLARTGFETLKLPENLDEISEWAFEYAVHLKKIKIPDGITKINKGTFARCFELEKVTFSPNIDAIDDWAFYRCSVLKSAKIPDGVKTIGEKAFYKDHKLNSVTINGNSIESIGKSAFIGIKKGATFTIKAKNKKRYNTVVKMIKKTTDKGMKYKYKKS